MRVHLFLILLLAGGEGLSQEKAELFSIKNDGKYLSQKCESYYRIFRKLPPDYRYTVEVFDGIIYFIFPSYDDFRLLFNKNRDGIAVDIVSRDQYDCSSKTGFTSAGAFKGQLLPPMYKRKMLKNASVNELGYVYVQYGDLPAGVDEQNVEMNLVVLQKRYVCGYYSFSNLEFHNWKLLETGAYGDSLPNSRQKAGWQEIEKTLEFSIPFAKNQTEFNADDLKPLRDTLHLTDYHVKSINIRAYSSVEGSYERNLALQEGRAASLVQALQSFQRPEIQSEISSNENWVDFNNDITGTPYQFLAKLSQEEVKARLSEDSELLQKLEPMLQRHRKGLVQLQLIKRFAEDENDPETLASIFGQAVEAENMAEAIYLQQQIFALSRAQKLPDGFIERLEVPESSSCAPLKLNFLLFAYERDTSKLDETLTLLAELDRMVPGNPKIQYNIAAFTIESWARGKLPTESKEIRKLILGLEKKGIHRTLTRRLLVNYEIVMTEYFDLEQDLKNRNRSLREVYGSYKKLALTDEDRVSLAKFLSFYSQFVWAENVLYPRIRQVDASEELLFYYLQLTISNRRKTRQSQFKTLLLNAIDKNPIRFCATFLSRGQGGFTFQLLDDQNLRKIYCEHCGG